MGDPNRHGNIRRVVAKFHNAWHLLFGNRTPFEVVLMVIDSWSPVGYFKEVRIVAEWDEQTYTYELGGEGEGFTKEEAP